MTTVDTAKKRPSGDWHRADIVAALHRRGMSLRRLSKEHGYSPVSLQKALHTPYPKAERIIASYIGVRPQDIWPSRYDARSQRDRTARRNRTFQSRRTTGGRNAQKREVA